MNSDPQTPEDRVWERLEDVLDPCSTFTEKPQSVVDLGLIDGVVVDDGQVTVDLLPTNQLCMYIPHMIADIETRVGDLPVVESVTVEPVADEVWTQDRMTNEAAAEREAYFRDRIEAHDVTPAYDGQQWTDEVRLDTARTSDGQP
jgi:metal-sulfur cluster biosynthetic enzyme